jgi:hypothetical protein
VKFSRIAHLAIVQKREREAAALQAKAERIARSLVPSVSLGEQYPLEIRDDWCGLGATLQLNARPESRDLMVRMLPRVELPFRERTWSHVQTFRMRAVEYGLQRDQMRLVWYGYAPSEDFPSAEVRTCLHGAMAELSGLESAVRALHAAVGAFTNDRIRAATAASMVHIEGLKADVLDALMGSTQRWEAGNRVGLTGGP